MFISNLLCAYLAAENLIVFGVEVFWDLPIYKASKPNKCQLLSWKQWEKWFLKYAFISVNIPKIRQNRNCSGMNNSNKSIWMLIIHIFYFFSSDFNFLNHSQYSNLIFHLISMVCASTNLIQIKIAEKTNICTAKDEWRMRRGPLFSLQKVWFSTFFEFLKH